MAEPNNVEEAHPERMALPAHNRSRSNRLISPSSFTLGDTVCSLGKASRVAVLNDGAAYFSALREVLLKARRRIQIVGWDIHSETRLVGESGEPHDRYPAELGPFLQALVASRPELHVDILIWDFAVLYAAEREWNSRDKFTSGTDGRIRYCADSSLPLGSAQHQKIVVVDGVVAFVGGLDLTIRRWDTPAHAPHHPLRCDPQGKPYPPFHDVQCLVEGEPARALSAIVAQRWRHAGHPLEAPHPLDAHLWPSSLPAQAHDIAVGIARTEVATETQGSVREVERLFERSIETAQRLIYIENQFISADGIARRLAARLAAVPQLKLLVVTPKLHGSWLESQAMQGARIDFVTPFHDAGVADRVRFLHPEVKDGEEGVAVMVHSKVMIVDDHFLRIGSANLNNRSMGADSECDLAFESSCEAHSGFIAQTRRALIGHFIALSPAEVGAGESDIFTLLERAGCASRTCSLQPIICDKAALQPVSDLVRPIADPKQPLQIETVARRLWSGQALIGGGVVLLAAMLALAWSYTPLRDYADIGLLRDMVGRYATSPAAAMLLVIAAFVLGGLVVFPVTVLIAATAVALGPWMGGLSATVGVAASATLLFFAGRLLGQQRVQSLLGKRALRIQDRIVGNAVISVATIRMLPIAPFTLINLFAGASKLRYLDFILGTLLGIGPGIVAMAALGSQIADLLEQASWTSVLYLGITVVAWIGVGFLLQRWLRRSGRRP